MAKLECALYGDFAEILLDIENTLCKNRRISCVGRNDFFTKNCRCAVRIFDKRYLLTNDRFGMTVTLFQEENRIIFSAITSGVDGVKEFNDDFFKYIIPITEKYRVIKEIKDGKRTLQIRHAIMNDLDVLEKIEKTCFPETEAASRMAIFLRLREFADHFWIIETDGKAIGFIDGAVTDETTIDDTMFEDASLHKPDGDYQAVFGINVLPEYRRNGYGAMLMQALIDDAKASGRKGCILTCKEPLIPYYEKFGYVNQGVSKSEHGGAVWYDMLLEF